MDTECLYNIDLIVGSLSMECASCQGTDHVDALAEQVARVEMMQSTLRSLLEAKSSGKGGGKKNDSATTHRAGPSTHATL